MSSIRSVIIGLGQIGAGYDAELDSARYAYSHARALEQHSNFSLMAGVDTQSANRDRFSKLYNVAAYERYNGIAFDEAPALVIVAVPTEFHWQVVQEVIKVAAPKVILCEKPLSFDAKEARQIVQLCNEHQVQLFVNYFRRSEPAVLQINERIQNGAIAAPLKAVVWYSKGFLHNGSHFFNLLEFWLGAFIQGSQR